MTKVIKTPYAVGNRFATMCGIDLKIIGKGENYFMCRYLKCAPFVKSVKEFRSFLSHIKAKQLK